MGSIKINGENFMHLLIEIAYLTFSCKFYGKVPAFAPGDMRIEEAVYPERRFTIYAYYGLAEDTSQNFSYSGLVDAAYEFLMEFVGCCEERELLPP